MTQSEVISWDPDRYRKNAAFVPDYGRALVDELAPRPGERILDLGCGDGVLTAELVARGAAVLGVDASVAMVEAARARGIDARVGFAEALEVPEGFDAAFTNAALHWTRDPAAVARGVFCALRPGGRYVGELGGHACVAALRTALRAALLEEGADPEGADPWYFPTAAAFTSVLEREGFAVDSVEWFARSTPLPTGALGWFETFAGSYLDRVEGSRRDAVARRAAALVEPALRDADGAVHADYTRLRFRARRPVR